MEVIIEKMIRGRPWPNSGARGAILYTVSLTFIIVDLFHSFATQVFAPGFTPARIAGIIALVPLIGAPLLYRRTQKIFAPAIILLTSVFLATFFSAFTHGGITAPTVPFLIVCPAVAVLLLGHRSAMAFVALAAAGVALLGYLTIAGQSLVSPHSANELRILFGSAVVLTMLSVAFVAHAFDVLARISVAEVTALNARLEDKAAELFANERLLSAVMEAASDGIIAVNKDGETLFINKAARDLLSGATTDAASQAWRDAAAHRATEDGSTLASENHPLAKALITRDVEEAELEISAGDATRTVFFSAAPILDNLDACRGAVAILRDVTVEKRQQKELTSQKEDLEQFARVAAHDLQSPLNNILMRVEAIGAEAPTIRETAAESHLQNIQRTATNMSSLLRGMLSLASIRAELSDLQEVWPDECADAAAYTAGIRDRSDVNLVIKNMPAVQANPMLLTQVFQNLIVNACKFVPTGAEPRIELSGYADGEWAVLCVADNGIGIDAASLERIFRPLERLNRTGEYEGTGLGLSICQKAVAKMGGEIWAESKPGEGAQFKIRLRSAASMRKGAA